MTEADLYALLRPHLARALAEGERRGRAAAREELERERLSTFAADSDDGPHFRAAFGAEDVGRLGDYFADTDGAYPGTLHRHFGLGLRQFADASRLVRKQITGSDGVTRWHWVKRDAPAKPGEQPKATSRPAADPKPGPARDEAHAESARKAADEVAAEVADAPELRADPGLRARVADLALTAAARAYKVALDVTHSKALGHVAELLGAVFDTPSDLAKLGYNPTTSAGTAAPTVADPVRAQLGVSGHLVASIASKVIVKALYAVKGRLGGGAQMSDGAGTGAAADWLADLYDAVHEALGLPPVDRGAVRAAVAGLGAPQQPPADADDAPFGFSDDGAVWFSDALYQTFAASARAGLKLTTVTDKNGNQVRRWVREGTAAGADKHANPGSTHGPDHVVSRALADPSKLSADDVKALADHAATLNKEQLRQLSLAFQQKIGGTKTDLANRLLAHVRGKTGGAPEPPPKPQLPDPDYRQKDPNAAIAKAIVADAKARAVLDRVRVKVAEADAAKSAAFDAELEYNRKRFAYNDAQEPGPYKKSKAWQAKAEAYKKARDEYNASFEAWGRAKEIELKARAAVREELVSALAHNTKSALREEWHDDTADTPFDTVALPKTDATRKVVSDAKAFVTSVCANLGDVPVSYGLATGGRAFACKNTGGKDLHAVAMSYEPGTAAADAKGYSVEYATQVQVHELGHVIEFTKPGVEELANEFVEYRCQGEARTNLAQRFPINGYKGHEEGRKDDFDRAFGPGSSAYYVGKTYSDGHTEVISMGLEKLYADPAGFVKADPEYAQFLFKVLTM